MVNTELNTKAQVSEKDTPSSTSSINASNSSVNKVSRPFGVSIDNFYITDFVGENSAIMAKASKTRIKNNLFKEKSIYN